MNDKGPVVRERRLLPLNERLYVFSLSVLIAGLAHGAPEQQLGEDCRVIFSDEGVTQKCVPLGRKTPSSSPPAGATGNRTEAPPAGGVGGEERLATDGAAGPLDGVTAAPNEAIELFRLDIEPAVPEEEELPSAVDRDLFNLGYVAQKTSDDYEARGYTFSYRNHRREWFWPWQEAASRALDVGLDVSRSKGEVGTTQFVARHAQGMLGAYLTRGTYLEAQLGRHILETDQGERTITSRHGSVMFGLTRSFSVQLETGRDFIYSDGAVTGGITRQLTALEHSAAFRWRPHQRLRILGQGGYRQYDEENEENVARQADMSAMYGISPEWPWVWAGLGAYALKYEKEVADYWSPTRYVAYGPRLESSFPLYKRLSATAALNLNRQSENGVKGNGYDIKAGMQYRLYGHLYARLELSKAKSLQYKSTWKSDNIFFTLSGPLF